MEMRSYEIWYYCVIGAITAVAVLICAGRRRLPPGPPALPLVGHLHLLEPNVHEQFSRLSDRYGPLMTIKLGMQTTVVVSSSAMAKEILGEHDQTFSNRSMPVAAKCIFYDGADILCCPYGPRLRLLRKMCVKGFFSSKSLEGFYSLRKSVVHRIMSSIYEDSINGHGVNILATALRTTLDIITNILWSQTSATCTGRNWKEFEDIVGQLVHHGFKPNVSDLLPFLKIFDLQGIYGKAQQLRDRLDRFLDGIIDERLSGLISRNDFLQSLVELMKSDVDGEGDETLRMTTKDVKAVLVDMLVAATDTTSNTLEWAMAELLRNPDIMKRVQKELEDVVGMERMVEESDIAKLPYLQAVVKEVFRLHPAGPLLLPRSPDKPCSVGGYHIPKDTPIYVNVWKLQRNPQVWKDPLVFNPDRFMESRWDYNGREYDFMPFGAGRRICLGLPLGAALMHYILASFVHCFEWSLPEGETMDMSNKLDKMLRKVVPVIAIPKPRLLPAEKYY